MRPNHHNHAAIQKADGDPAWLSIILPVILCGVIGVGENLSRAAHIETACLQRPIPLGLIKFDLHFCYYKKSMMSKFL